MRVLDLGCGDGTLLVQLKKEFNIKELGIEINHQNINHCLNKGLQVIHQDLNKDLDNFETQSYDLVLMNYALQEIRAPAKLLKAMVRIGKLASVSIPNMGYWQCRLQIAIHGRMPISDTLPYSWHDSKNIHLSTLRDFENLCHQQAITIKGRFSQKTSWLTYLSQRSIAVANLMMPTATYCLSKNNDKH